MEDVEVGSRRKNKPTPKLNENTKTRKRQGEVEVLEVSNLLKNEFGSAVATMQHCREQ